MLSLKDFNMTSYLQRLHTFHLKVANISFFYFPKFLFHYSKDYLMTKPILEHTTFWNHGNIFKIHACQVEMLIFFCKIR